ncbi:PREDICTED: uncharacterized protein LOC104708539 [Camelina sativa]|uniref:Uncharacterized protein LOC104708539 n=1 Tax=Camelina sativa TaxID=90675 RepID=A0ABM0TAW6_CAMSA|nr:PREDICTED: uncharacterized protein LOC104708539 [Camelina sativa]XP_019099988.1 PREDICTED: uncharacterized protein LOC104708539 [Camelina sativa]XP_019099993.1 PREDICTED: uncharacterized protein LOC104708539 [Camelina sativa]
MEPENSQPFGRDTPEQDPAPAPTEDEPRKRVAAYDLMSVEGDLEGVDKKKEEMHKILDQIREKASSVLDSSLRSEEIDKPFDLLKQRAMELDLKEESVRKQILDLERMRKEAELMEASLKELESRENELRLLNDTIREKSAELEKKEEIFELRKQEEAIEVDVKRKFLELKEKELEEREKEIELKQREVEELSMQAGTRKRRRLESGPPLLATNDRDAEALGQHKHNDEDMEKDSASTFSPVQISEGHEKDIEEVVVSIDDSDEEHEPLLCVHSEFADFSKTMRSFKAGQVWALYDGIDSMPRLYGRIKKINKRGTSLQLTWFEHKDEDSVPAACGRFKVGITETISQLTFSHVMNPIIHSRHFIAVIPRKGETWALFRDWSKSWNNNPEQHRPPYKFDFVEVLVNFDDCLGVGVAYLGKVEGFVSVYEQAGQHGVVSLMIAPEEMQRFSHRVPSLKLNGKEREGVPAGSFELDPAAIKSVPLTSDCSSSEEEEETESQSEDEDCGKTGEVEDQDGLRKDFPIVLD